MDGYYQQIWSITLHNARILHTKLYSELLGVITGLLYFASIIGGLVGILLGNVKNIEYGEIGSPFLIIL